LCLADCPGLRKKSDISLFQKLLLMKNLILWSLLLISIPTLSQKNLLFETKEYKHAYRNGTRSRDGLPGEKYWQNTSDYKITAEFDPQNHLISGHLTMAYHNQSPDSLNTMVFKLMQNLYQKGASRQMPVNPDMLHDGIKISNLKYEEQDVAESNMSISGTVMNVRLPGYISQNSKAKISMDFVTPVPKKAGLRSGTIDSTSFFIAYWFPQVAVYDDIFGWDRDEYVGVPETYNDFANYDVEITLPNEYNIWATGAHQNPEEIYSKEILARIAASKSSKKPVMILDEKDFRKARDAHNTWKFHAENVPDFAWGTSDHYLWQGVSVANPNSNNLCWVQTAYAKGDANFEWVIEVAKNSVEIFSSEFPAIPYPYFKHISFSGTQGGGMEFPMLANNHATRDTVSTIVVTAHELAHNYFPFMMGINERKYGWWDETMTTLMESYVKDRAYPERKLLGFFNRKQSYPYLSSSHEIMPLMTETSSMMKVSPSIINFYVKGPAAMDGLQNLLGVDRFNTLLKGFIKVWQGKHPTPYDFFYYINTQEQQNLNWFWDASFFAQGYPDLAIAGASQHGEYLSIKIQNVGGLPVPFLLTITPTSGESHDEEYNVKRWKKNPEFLLLRVPIDGKVEKVELSREFFYDSDPTNNELLISEQ
jgi:hypothetical protein